MGRTTREAELLTVLFLLGFGVVVIRNAWLSDDAYITFRTVDNLVNGYGLTWNPGERVQAYTHPLWMFLVSAVYFFSREIYFTSLFLSIVVSLLAVSFLAWRAARSTFSVSLGIAILALSKAFVDYSTSGLENPLTHLILVLFLLVYIQSEPGLRRLFYLALLTALGTLNRVDTVLLFLPVLGYALLTLRAPLKNRLAVVAIGLTPFVLWELFSLFYYGFPFPNTAYAKLNVGLVSRSELLGQGVDYFLNSIHLDPVTPLVISLGIIAPLVLKASQLLPAVASILLYLLYVLWIGGDFMSGRFFAAPLLVAVTVLMNMDLSKLKAGRFALFALVLGVGLSSSYSPVLPGFNRNAGTDSNRITDEKGNYWSNTALLRAGHHAPWPDHDWAQEGRSASIQSPGVVEKGSVGFYGYFAGPQVHVVDLLGLADPLLARLPPVDPHWSIGHFGRRAPEGYIETLASGENRIQDQNLAIYYDKLSFVTRGDLFDLRRLGEIWKLNTGAYDHYLKAYAIFEGEAFRQRLTFTNPTDAPYACAFVWNNGTAEAFLLDDASRRGSVYSVTWVIRADGVAFEGDYKEKIASIGALDDETTLNVGVFFSSNLDLTSNNIFEHRYWFRIAGDRLVILLQGIGWHNEAAPGGTWVEADVSDVIERNWPLGEDRLN